MPYYTISYGVDQTYGENVGNSFSKYIVNDLLRGRLGYDGVVCTDWGITHDMGKTEEEFAGKMLGRGRAHRGGTPFKGPGGRRGSVRRKQRCRPGAGGLPAGMRKVRGRGHAQPF